MAATVRFAVVDVNEYLSKRQEADVELSTEWAKLEELYNKKLWHQLTLRLQQLVTHTAMQSGDALIQLYNNFLSTFESKINPMSLVEIVAHVVKQFSDKKEAVQFLDKIEQKVKINDEAVSLCKVIQGQIYLEQLNDLDATKKIIEDLEATLEDADGVTSVHGRFYKLASEYYRVRGPMSKYYRSALRYVGVCGRQLGAGERRACATRLCVAAALAPDVYTLAELLEHPILDSLTGTPDEWAKELVAAVSSGDVAAFDAVRQKSNLPELRRADRQLRQKIAVLCLMEMAHARDASARKLTFQEIATAAKVELQDVELLVMKALAEGLIKGHIDQVSGAVAAYRCGGRALPRAGVSALAARVEAWRAAAAAASAHLTPTAHQLLA